MKHGFYASRFTKDETARLDVVSPDASSEIALLRVFVSRIQDQLDGKRSFSENDLKMLNTLSIMVQSISASLRTNAFLKGGDSGVEAAIEEALLMIREDWGIR